MFICIVVIGMIFIFGRCTLSENLTVIARTSFDKMLLCDNNISSAFYENQSTRSSLIKRDGYLFARIDMLIIVNEFGAINRAGIKSTSLQMVTYIKHHIRWVLTMSIKGTYNVKSHRCHLKSFGSKNAHLIRHVAFCIFPTY